MLPEKFLLPDSINADQAKKLSDLITEKKLPVVNGAAAVPVSDIRMILELGAANTTINALALAMSPLQAIQAGWVIPQTDKSEPEAVKIIVDGLDAIKQGLPYSKHVRSLT